MMITDDFVMLNFPKTGSSFARMAIRRAYEPYWILQKMVLAGLWRNKTCEYMMPNLDFSFSRERKENQHGVYRQIPDFHRDKKIISITRNPFSRYVSAYTYGSWRQKKRFFKYPNFPNLSFAEFYEMKHKIDVKDRLGGILPQIELGFHSIQFIQFYFKNPSQVLQKIDNKYIDSGEYVADMCKIKFLQQENLNAELKDFLSAYLPEKRIQFLLADSRINVSKKIDNFEDYHTFDTHTKILLRDKLIFKIFMQYQ